MEQTRRPAAARAVGSVAGRAAPIGCGCRRRPEAICRWRRWPRWAPERTGQEASRASVRPECRRSAALPRVDDGAGRAARTVKPSTNPARATAPPIVFSSSLSSLGSLPIGDGEVRFVGFDVQSIVAGFLDLHGSIRRADEAGRVVRGRRPALQIDLVAAAVDQRQRDLRQLVAGVFVVGAVGLAVTTEIAELALGLDVDRERRRLVEHQASSCSPQERGPVPSPRLRSSTCSWPPSPRRRARHRPAGSARNTIKPLRRLPFGVGPRCGGGGGGSWRDDR